MKTLKPKIAHIIPTMNYGGVEVAIQKSERFKQNFDYKIFTVKNLGKPRIGQKNYIYLIKYIISQKWVPDVIITYGEPYSRANSKNIWLQVVCFLS